jgi:hypothetical protein
MASTHIVEPECCTKSSYWTQRAPQPSPATRKIFKSRVASTLLVAKQCGYPPMNAKRRLEKVSMHAHAPSPKASTTTTDEPRAGQSSTRSQSILDGTTELSSYSLLGSLTQAAAGKRAVTSLRGLTGYYIWSAPSVLL